MYCGGNEYFLDIPTHSVCLSADIWGEREGRDPEEEGSGAVLFVYLWTLLLFAGLVYVGNMTRSNISNLQTLRLTLFAFVNYCFVIMVLLIGLEGAIETEGRDSASPMESEYNYA